jgi:small GTP-binding protein
MSSDLPLKTVIILGDANVGKSSIFSRFVNDRFSTIYMPTIAIDFKIKICDVNGSQTKLRIYDTSGRSRFNTIIGAYIPKADRVIIVYDKEDLKSFHNIKFWMNMVQRQIENSNSLIDYDHTDQKFTSDHFRNFMERSKLDIILVENKSDLVDKIQVSTAIGQNFALDHKMDFIEVSALSGTGINELFMGLYFDVKEPECE